MEFNEETDEGFLSLLSAQREILKQLKRETAKRANGLVPTAQMEESRKIVTPISIIGNDSDPFNLMNEPIIEHRSVDQDASFQKVKSQRISDFDIPPPCLVPALSNSFNGSGQYRGQNMIPNKLSHLDAPKSSRGAERENGVDGTVANTFLFDSSSTAVRASNNVELYHATKSDISVFMRKPAVPRDNKFDSNIDFVSLRREFKSFIAAMEKSMKSQQDIHDWDRKMGLKRSHSKTMRLSMRSRKRLRKIVVNKI